ncbi:MAG: substrate binding domain-containing protein, partial [Pseudomonadota bacterium]
GSLRVALPVDAAEAFLWAPILDFAAKHPDLRLSLDHDDRLVDLTAGGHDVAVRIGRLPDSSLRARRLGDSPRILCAEPSYLAARGHPNAPEDLSSHDVIHYSNAPASQIWRFVPAGDGEPVSVQVAPRISCNNGAMMRAAAEAGLGLTVLPQFLVAEALDAGRLVAADMPWEPEPDGVFALMAQASQASPKLRAFVDHLVACMKRRDT